LTWISRVLVWMRVRKGRRNEVEVAVVYVHPKVAGAVKAQWQCGSNDGIPGHLSGYLAGPDV